MLEIGLLFLGLLGLVVVFGVPYLLVSHARLKARVAILEARHAREKTPGVTKAEEGAGIAQPVPNGGEEAKAVVTPDDASKPAWPIPAATRASPTDEKSSTDTTAADTPNAAQEAPRAFVFQKTTFKNLSQWLRENWVLAAGAASLALAGIFMVQYGAEHGLLTPFWRVMAALGFGTALIAGGEVIRRRFGDEAAGSVQYLPSALAGAGLIALFSGILAARAMYGLLDPGPAFLALCLVSALALVLGWFYGPMLSALGIIGATAAPFLVGGQSDATWVLYYYFTLIAVVGLAVDTVKRWAWVSVLALFATLSASLLLFLTDAGELHFLIATLLIAGASIVIPERSLTPHHSGPSMLEMRRLVNGKRVYPEFTTRLSAAVTCAATASAILVVLDAAKSEEVYLGISALIILLIATVIWMRQAPALFDHALVPGLATLAVPVIETTSFGPLFREFLDGAQRPPETAAPATIWILTAIGGFGSVLAFFRMQWADGTGKEGDNTPVFWALAAAVFAPIMMLVLEFLWQPAAVTGAYPWALSAIAMATMMTLLAERTARGRDIDQRALRVALFATAALTLIALAFFLLLAETALTLALAVMVLLTVLIDRKFDLPALGLFTQIGAAVVTYRLIIDPGVSWATDFELVEEIWVAGAPIAQVLLAYVGTLILLAGAWYVSRSARPKTRLILESTFATIGAVFLSVMIIRMISEPGGSGHAEIGLLAAVWAASMFNQLYRMQSSSRFSHFVRGGLATAYGLALLFFLLGLFGDANPLFNSRELISGPPLLDSLAAAFLPLSGIFAVGAWKVAHFGRQVRTAFAISSSFLAAWYTALEIRRLWRGNDLTVSGITDPELYTYTLALLVTSTAILAIAFWRRSDTLRKIAMAGVVLTIAKVFLIDMSGLSGLIRVFSFMGLGLALVGLAWINRIMKAQWNKGELAAGVSGKDDS
ncbi:DUF2339 domain-containing protein [Leisingera sp. ANG-M7]|uniref:DUF2339 domain-containing protein n=1 Tax=Leisingera sp. ANG-M7 TaxID=1577902 RepID=UPI00057E5B03|nr:DUF2339 domain-containing protein [Leisingera sp. ANG-M7]KIC36755.1 hypothetical protein RA26_10510 [Leisingera sp. ANG-M7]